MISFKQKANELGLAFVKCIYKHDKDKNPVRDGLDKLMQTGHFDSVPDFFKNISD